MSLIEPAIKPVGGSWPEWKIYAELARRLGLGAEFWDGDFDKCVDYILEPSGLTAAELRKNPQGTLYPVPERTQKYYEKAGFQTPSGKVEIASSILAKHGLEALPVYKEPAESPLSRADMLQSYPLILTTGARKSCYTHSQFRNVPKLRQLMPEPLLDIHPKDAESRSIRSGDFVMIMSPRGSVIMKANVSDAILPGVVCAPHHWPGAANINTIIDDKNLDPISGFAALKSSLCNVMRA